MKKKTKFATRHLLPYSVKKNSSLRCIERLDEKKESTRFKGYFPNASSNKGNYPCGVGPPPTLPVFPLAFRLIQMKIKMQCCQKAYLSVGFLRHAHHAFDFLFAFVELIR